MLYIKTYEEFTESERKWICDHNLTYLFDYKNLDFIKFDSQTEKIREEIKRYGFDHFKVCDKVYPTYVSYDYNFEYLLSLLGINNLHLNFIVSEENANLFDLDFKLDDKLKYVGIGYGVYKTVAKHYKFITSNKDCLYDANKVWYKIICNPDFYSFTSPLFSGIIYKNIDDTKLKNILIKIKDNIDKNYVKPKDREFRHKREFLKGIEDIIFDKELTSKIEDFFGTPTNIH